MKKVFGFLAAGVLAACGSSNNGGGTVNAPPLTTFTYGSPQAVTAGSQQAQTASAGASNVQTTITAAQNNSAADAQAEPEELTDFGVEAVSGVADRAAPKDPSAAMFKKLVASQRSGQLDESCIVTSSDGTSITYNHCSLTSDGETITANGTLTTTPTSVTWNITFTIDEVDSSDNTTLDFTGQWQGTINFTFDSAAGTGSISGACTGAESVNESVNGTQYEFAFTVGLDFLALDYDNSCDGFFTSGTLEVREDVTSNTTGYNPPYPQAAVEFTWSACDSLEIAVSTN